MVRPASRDVDRPARAQRLSLLGSWLVIAIGSVVLLGWLSGLTALTNILPIWPTTKLNTAIGLVLAGIGVALHLDRGRWRESRARRSVGHAIALLVAMLGATALLQYGTGWNLGIDELLVADPDSVPSTPPGRMAILTAVAFLMSAGALWTLDRTPAGHTGVAEVLGFGILLSGFAAVFEFAQDPRVPITGIAAPTAIGFVLLGVAILFARPDRGTVAMILSSRVAGTVVRRLAPAAILIPFGFAWLEWIGTQLGLFDSAQGVIMFTTVTVALLVFVLWRTSEAVDRLDRTRVAAERKLALSDMILSHVGNVVAVADHEGAVRYVSPSAAQLLGYPTDALLGDGWWKLLYGRTRGEEIRQYVAAVARGEHPPAPALYETVVTDREGGEHTLLWKDAVGEDGMVVGVASDITELRHALSQVKHLSGLLPICSNCKKIRDDQGYWREVEAYVREHSDAEFSHALCPLCIKALYPELADEILDES